MFCPSCGKKITENSKFCKYCGSSQVETEGKEEKKTNKKDYKVVWTCDYCGEEFKTKAESDTHELKCIQNPKNKKILRNINPKRAWEYLWLTTMLVFFINIFITIKYEEVNVNLLNGKILGILFFSNIGLGIISFLAMIISSKKPKNNKLSIFVKYSLIICFFYILFNSLVFAVEGNTAKNDEGYKNKYYIEITPTITPTPTIEIKATPAVIPKKTVKPVQKAVETDPIIDCVSSYPNCNGSSIKLRRSQCSNITCCQIGDNWSVYPSSEKCKEAQNSTKPKTVNNPQIVPTTAVYSPNANKSPVFLSYSGYTIYCPSQNVDAVKSINSTMESKKSEWASKYNECTDTFIKTDSCWVSCSNTAFNELSFCSSTLDYKSSEYTSCRDKALDNQSLCLNKCPSSSNACQWVYSEQKNLSSQISNLCK